VEKPFKRDYDGDDKSFNRDYQRWYRKQYPDRSKHQDLKKSYGISFEDYQNLSDEQGGVCAICGNTEQAVRNNSNVPRNLAVDHSHTSGKVRGLLCTHCNQGIGNFRENPEFMAKAISYLLRRKRWPVDYKRRRENTQLLKLKKARRSNMAKGKAKKPGRAHKQVKKIAKPK
jgi:hypothetical protein